MHAGLNHILAGPRRAHLEHAGEHARLAREVGMSDRTLRHRNLITRLSITEFSAGLNPGSNPQQIALVAHGNLWFTDQGTTARSGGRHLSGPVSVTATATGAAITVEPAVQLAAPPPPTPAPSALDITPRMFALRGRRVGRSASARGDRLLAIESGRSRRCRRK
jgi:hypothetical protein